MSREKSFLADDISQTDSLVLREFDGKSSGLAATAAGEFYQARGVSRSRAR